MLPRVVASKQHLLEGVAVVGVAERVDYGVHQAIDVMHVFHHRDQREEEVVVLARAGVMENDVEEEEGEPADEEQDDDDADHGGKAHLVLEPPMLLLPALHRVEYDHVGHYDDDGGKEEGKHHHHVRISRPDIQDFEHGEAS